MVQKLAQNSNFQKIKFNDVAIFAFENEKTFEHIVKNKVKCEYFP